MTDPSQVQKFAQIIPPGVGHCLGVHVDRGSRGVVCWHAPGWGKPRFRAIGRNVGSSQMVVGIAVVLGGAIGFAIGQGRAFWYRLQAQIEANTAPE